MNFSNNYKDSLSFTDSWGDLPYDDLQSCDFKTTEPQIHNFTVNISTFSSPKIALAIHVKKLVILMIKMGSNILMQVCLRVLMSSSLEGCT